MEASTRLSNRCSRVKNLLRGGQTWPMIAAMKLEPGVRLGAYQILAELARGAIPTVYPAYQPPVKPYNSPLARPGGAIPSAFGLGGGAERADSERLTQTGAMVGRPTYMSPEQCAGHEAGPPADIYALGVIAFEMITGRVPFNAPTPLGVIAAHQMTPPPSPRKLNPSLPESVVQPILTCLAKDPRQRQETATEFVEQLPIAVAASATQCPLTPPPTTPPPPAPATLHSSITP